MAVATNPWEVESLQDFLFLKCPECVFDTKEEDCFQMHAVDNHPLSYVLFGETCKEEIFETDINNEDYDVEHMEDFETEIPEFSSNSPEVCSQNLLEETMIVKEEVIEINHGII